MWSYFFDSSAIAKRYVRETGQGWVKDLCLAAKSEEGDLYISEVAEVEIVRVICAKARETPSSRRKVVAARDGMIEQFTRHCDPITGEYDVVAFTPAIIHQARVLCKRHGIKSFDAVQLATAMVIRDFEKSAGYSSPIFVTADAGLQRYARAENFTVEDPEEHPYPGEPPVSRTVSVPLRRQLQFPLKWVGLYQATPDTSSVSLPPAKQP